MATSKIGSWVFELYREYLEKEIKNRKEELTEAGLANGFENALNNGSIKILVQEPWMGTIRFKTLAFHPALSEEARKLYENPMAYLLSRYGGGKFKVNFYRGMNFVATRNFKPEGEPLWKDLAEPSGDY